MYKKICICNGTTEYCQKGCYWSSDSIFEMCLLAKKQNVFEMAEAYSMVNGKKITLLRWIYMLSFLHFHFGKYQCGEELLHNINNKKNVFLFCSFLECNCHNKAEDCYYNQTIADQKRSMNIHGQYTGGGVCLNCSQHTTGINCEMCADGYFRPQKVRFGK